MIRGRGAVAPGPTSAGDPYVPRRGSASFAVERYDLSLRYRVVANRLSGTATITATARAELDRCSLDLGGALRVARVKVDGKATRWVHRLGKLHVTLPRPLPAGDGFVVEVGYEGNPRPLNGTWGVIGWEELDDGVIVASQPDGASSWFPCNDHPSDKATYGIAIEVESAYEVVANGRLVRSRRGASSTRWEFEQSEPMAAYLATVQIGRYRPFDLERGRSATAVRVWAPPQHHQAVATDLAAQVAMLDVFEGCFGPYPFAAGYAVVVTADSLEIPLEAQGLSVFGANHLDGAGAEERLVAHELAHQWFGNALTVAAWQHIWLQEGFACYAEWLWSEASDGPNAAALAVTHHAGLAALAQDLVLADPGADAMFDDRVYKRGALVLHELRTDVGDETFFALLRSWVASHLHGWVTTDDFLAHVAAVAGPPAADRLRPWLFDETLPALP